MNNLPKCGINHFGGGLAGRDGWRDVGCVGLGVGHRVCVCVCTSAYCAHHNYTMLAILIMHSEQQQQLKLHPVYAALRLHIINSTLT